MLRVYRDLSCLAVYRTGDRPDGRHPFADGHEVILRLGERVARGLIEGTRRIGAGWSAAAARVR